jgi:hypothetical protein
LGAAFGSNLRVFRSSKSILQIYFPYCANRLSRARQQNFSASIAAVLSSLGLPLRGLLCK